MLAVIIPARNVHGGKTWARPRLGASAAAYQAVDGFRSLEANEDVALVDALRAVEVTIAWSADVR
jgi:hypothetical protein